MFGSFELLAGDWDSKKTAQFVVGKFIMPSDSFKGEAISLDQVESIEIATEDNSKKWGNAAGWGLAAGLATGGIGLVAGLLLGGNKKTVVFICQLKDGRKFMGRADRNHYQKMSSAFFDSEKITKIKLELPTLNVKPSLDMRVENSNQIIKTRVFPALLIIALLLFVIIWIGSGDKVDKLTNEPVSNKSQVSEHPKKASLLKNIVDSARN